jgi:hypothetical protein
LTRISADQKEAKQKKRTGTARLPAAAPAIRFPGYLNYIFNTVRSPENFQKKFLEQAPGLFQKIGAVN